MGLFVKGKGRERKRKSVSVRSARARKTKKRLRKLPSHNREKGVKIQKSWSLMVSFVRSARPHNQQHKREKYVIKTLSEKECARTV